MGLFSWFSKETEPVDIFVGNISSEGAVNEVYQHLKTYLACAPKLVSVRNLEGNRFKYALATAKSRRDADDFIRTISNTEIGGHTLVAHEYTHRSYSNEGRVQGSPPEAGSDRRHGDRRHNCDRRTAKDRRFENMFG